MQTFDQSLFDLYKNGLITYEDALQRATKPDDFVLKIKGIRSTSEWQEGVISSEKKEDPKIDRFGD